MAPREDFERFFPFSAEEKELLASLPELLPLEEIWLEVYRYAREYPEGKEILKDVLEDQEALYELARRGASFFKKAFVEIFSSGFHEEARRVAHLHLERGVTPAFLMGAIEALKWKFIREIKARNIHGGQCLPAFSKFFTYLSALLLEEFFQTTINHLQCALEASSRKTKFLNVLRDINYLLFEKNICREELFRKACRILSEVGEIPFVWISRLDEGGKVIKEATFPEKHPFFTKIPSSLQEFPAIIPFLEKVFQGVPAVLDDLSKIPGYEERQKILKNFGVNSIALIPLFEKEKVSHIIVLYQREKRSFLPEEIKLLAEVGRDLSVGLRNIQHREEIERAIFVDELTGLPNKKQFLSLLPKIFLEKKEKAEKLALLRIDILNFSHLNRVLGYHTGDEILKEVARRLKDFFGEQSLIARVGPDEFAILYAFESLEAVQDTVFALEKTLKTPFHLENQDALRLSFGIGIALWPQDASNPFELFEKAALALKETTFQIGGGTSFYISEKDPSSLKNLYLLKELEEAFEKGEFVLYYQPKIDLISRFPTAFEALIRWQHPEKGLIPPGYFIPVLEESSLMIDVGYWIIDTAAAFLARIKNFFPKMKISVNLSLRQLNDETFVSRLGKIVARHELYPEDLELEIVERTLIHARALETLEELRKYGFHLVLDDFGTGYSSFRYIQALRRIDLKIDRSFVSHVPDYRDQVTMMMAIVSMGKGLGQRIVAEGVETREQLAFITGLGIDEVQGFYFARPLPENQAVGFLKNYKAETYFWPRQQRNR